jgi:hypothetical protein
MPTKRTRRSRARAAELSPLQLAYLADEPLPPRAEWSPADMWWWTTERVSDEPGLGWFETSARALWERHQAELMERWMVDHPGRRPRCWWDYEAPRQPFGSWPGWWLDGKLPEPRLRLGGVGTPVHEVLAHVPEYAYGLPVLWVERWMSEYYNGRAKDIHGEPIGKNHKAGSFAGVPIDPDAPPLYESQAVYLERHGLLLPGERRRLRKADFEPEKITVEPLDEDGCEELMDLEPLGRG